MALTARQRNAGIPETQRIRTIRNALARAAQPHTSSSYQRVAPTARRRAGNQIRTVSRQHGTITRPGTRHR